MSNETGWNPLEYRVLVKLDASEETSSGGIIIPDSVKERRDMAKEEGTVLAIGGNAFEDWKDDRLPQPGDRVIFGKYAGTVHEKGKDQYRFLNDKDIIAVAA